MSKKAIIFDFDGTIVDVLPSLINILNRLSGKYGYNIIKEGDVNKLRAKTSKEMLKSVGISLLKLPFVVKSVKLELRKEIEFLKPVHGIKEALLRLRKHGYKLGIVTSNSEENVKKFLEANNLPCFDFVYSGSSFFGKAGMIKSILESQRLNTEETVYVGDETKDVDAAKNAGVQIISVSWGFNSRQILEKQKPDFLIDAPNELIKIVERL